jgi:hypothetical protein
MHHIAYLNDAKDSLIPTGFQGLPALIWIEKPYEVNSTDIPSMVAMTHPLVCIFFAVTVLMSGVI